LRSIDERTSRARWFIDRRKVFGDGNRRVCNDGDFDHFFRLGLELRSRSMRRWGAIGYGKGLRRLHKGTRRMRLNTSLNRNARRGSLQRLH